MSGESPTIVADTRLDDEPSLDAGMFSYHEPCPYLPEQTATLQGFAAQQLDPAIYRGLLDHGFRRSGAFFYRPHCSACNQCIPLRVNVEGFMPSRSQRRCWGRNANVTVDIARPSLTPEKARLYEQYQRQKHSQTEEKGMGALADFLYNPVVDSVEFSYRDPGGQLVAVGICDVLADALSSVYCYYDATQTRRGLGTFSALFELNYAKRQRLTYYYLGYLVRGCRAMRYKASYRPYELLDSTGRWREVSPARTSESESGLIIGARADDNDRR